MPMREQEDPDQVAEETKASQSTATGSVGTGAAEAKADDDDISSLLVTEESYNLIPTKPVISSNYNTDPNYDNRQAKRSRLNQPPGGYPCNRCKEYGHHEKNCPKIGDKDYDPVLRLSNIPTSTRTVVMNLDEIDAKGKMVINYTRHNTLLSTHLY